MFGEIYKFTESYTPRHMPHITFNKGDEMVLIHNDTKYEHYFYHKQFRGPIKMPNNIFKILEKNQKFGYKKVEINNITKIYEFEKEFNNICKNCGIGIEDIADDICEKCYMDPKHRIQTNL